MKWLSLVAVLGLVLTACGSRVVSSEAQPGSDSEIGRVDLTLSTGVESMSIDAAEEPSEPTEDGRAVTELTAPTGPVFVRPSPAPVHETTTAPAQVASDTATERLAPVSDLLKQILDLARLDLTARLGVAEASIATVLAEFVTWSDSSLGCPRPGISYLQVLTDGARIRLDANGVVYEYHSGPAGVPFLCESALFQSPTPPGSEDS